MKIGIVVKDKEFYDDAQLLVHSFFVSSNTQVCQYEGLPSDTRPDIPADAEHDSKVSKYMPGMEYTREAVIRTGDGLIINVSRMEPLAEEKEGRSRGEIHDIFKRRLYDCLKEYTGKSLPWGFLTGVRPGKKAMAFLKQGKSREETIAIFKDRYLTTEEKALMATDIAENELKILKENVKEQGYSLYVGIPFCPTTCAYCSFTSFPIEQGRKKGLVRNYIDTLKAEFKDVFGIIIQSGNNTYVNTTPAGEIKIKSPASVYFGGGTPTSLSAAELDEVIGSLKEYFDLSETAEFCVEAGRPDSITKDKLEVLKKHGVNRISINPQTMNEKTLKKIGRRHTTEDVKNAFALAREAGFNNINTDIILGLPDEDIEDLKITLDEIMKLSPDSLTVHSLAIKRAARINTVKEDFADSVMENGYETVRLAGQAAAKMGLKPYYMYRQQNMVGNMENVGYASGGKESLYNIIIMEEIQSIIAFGAGASSKFIFGDRIERSENVKDILEYIKRKDEMVKRKEKYILLRV